MRIFRERVGIALAEALRAPGSSQNKIEEKAKLGTGELSRIKRGERAKKAISLDKLCDIADALDVTVDWLLGRTTAPSATSRLAAVEKRITALEEESGVHLGLQLKPKNRPSETGTSKK